MDVASTRWPEGLKVALRVKAATMSTDFSIY
jgi:hypothetical protein